MYPGSHARRNPDKPAVIEAWTGRAITYAELETRSVQFSRWLHKQGLRPGDHLAVLSVNDATVYELYWGAVRSGLLVTLVNTHLSADEVAYVVDDCGADVLVACADLAPLAEKIGALTPNVRHRLAFGGVIAGHTDYCAAIAPMSTEPPQDQPRGADMLYSSGTTGRPKGIEPSLGGEQIGDEPGPPVTARMRAVFGFDEDSVYLSPAPIYHAAPLRYSAGVQALGGTVILLDRFDAEQALSTIEKYAVTHSQWVPTHFVRMLKLPAQVRARYDVSSIQFAIHAAAPCPVDVKRAMIEWWGEVIYEYYSSTESVGSTTIGPQEWLRKPGSVGRASAGIVHICDENGAELPTGRVGLIYFERNDYSFVYHNDPEKTATAYHSEYRTWATTGDLGYLDDDGYLFLTDRAKFVIISGGVNIYPQEIENCLSLHPDVTDVAVIGIPDDEMGQTVRAVVQPAPGTIAGDDLAAEIIEYCRAHIAHYKCPRSVEFVDELPRTPTGKIVKGAL